MSSSAYADAQRSSAESCSEKRRFYLEAADTHEEALANIGAGIGTALIHGGVQKAAVDRFGLLIVDQGEMGAHGFADEE